MSISDAIKLKDYEEIDYFVKEYKGIRDRQKITDQLNLVESIRVAYSSLKSKTGRQQYTQWRHNKQDLLTPIEEEELNMFQQLNKDLGADKKLNLFEKLKQGRRP